MNIGITEWASWASLMNIGIRERASWAPGRNIKLKKRNRARGENPLPVRKNYYQELGEPTFSNGKKELWLNDYQYTTLLHPLVPPKTR